MSGASGVHVQFVSQTCNYHLYFFYSRSLCFPNFNHILFTICSYWLCSRVLQSPPISHFLAGNGVLYTYQEFIVIGVLQLTNMLFLQSKWNHKTFWLNVSGTFYSFDLCSLFYDYWNIKSFSHILNRCYVHNGLNRVKHDRTVDSIGKDNSSKESFGVKVNKHSFVWPAEFTLIAICSQMLQVTL